MLFSFVFSEYQFENAFPNLTFVDPVGIHHAGDGQIEYLLLSNKEE